MIFIFLSAEDCYEIGITAWNTSSPECVRQWMGESLHRLRHGDAAHAHYVNEIDVLKHIAMTFEEVSVFIYYSPFFLKLTIAVNPKVSDGYKTGMLPRVKVYLC